MERRTVRLARHDALAQSLSTASDLAKRLRRSTTSLTPPYADASFPPRPAFGPAHVQESSLMPRSSLVSPIVFVLVLSPAVAWSQAAPAGPTPSPGASGQ